MPREVHLKLKKFFNGFQNTDFMEENLKKANTS